MSTDYTASRDERYVIMYSRTAKVLGGIQYTMNSRKTQVNKKLKSLDKRINNLNRRLTNNAPVAISTKNGSKGKDYYRTNGRERISDVTALNSGYNVVDVFINPANSNLFPWLAGIGTKYDLYRFKRLKFNYVPALPTSEEGNIYLGIDYNTLDPVPATSTELCQLSHWSMNVVWKPTSLVVDVNNLDWLYTRAGPVANADYKTYDVGKLFFATEGINFVGVAGYVEVEYDVEFKRRQPDYVSRIIPSTDIYSPMAFLQSGSLANGAHSSSFTIAESNNSIIIPNANTGIFHVSKAVKVALVCYDGTNFQGALSQSSDGVTYTHITNHWYTILSPGIHYKLFNGTGGSASVRVLILVISDV